MGFDILVLGWTYIAQSGTLACVRRDWFVSYAYRDGALLGALTKALPENARAVVHPLQSQRRRQQISDVLIRKIQHASALVYPDTPATLQSRWCAMERDYARRAGKTIWKYSAGAGKLALDARSAADLNGVLLDLGATVQKRRDESVGWLLRGLRKKHFDILMPQDLNLSDHDWRTKLTGGFRNTATRSGMAVVAIGGLHQLWWELKAVLQVIGPTRTIFACLEKPVNSTDVRQMLGAEVEVVQLWPDGTKSAWHRLDDLIVASYSLFREPLE